MSGTVKVGSDNIALGVKVGHDVDDLSDPGWRARVDPRAGGVGGRHHQERGGAEDERMSVSIGLRYRID